MVNRLRGANGRVFWVAAAAILIIAVALILGLGIQKSSAQTNPQRTSQIVRGDIEETVTAPGQLTARGLDLPFSASGVISDVLVKPGSVVQTGQVLAKLDTRQAEQNLAAAIAAQKAAQGRLDTIQNGPARDLATAQQDLKIAQAQLNQIKSGNATDADKAAAQAGIDAAVYRYNSLVSRPNQREVAAGEAELRAAQANLANLKAGPLQAELDQANAAITAQQQNLDKVKTDTASTIGQATIALQKATATRDAAQDTFNEIHKDLYNDDGTVKTTTTKADLDREKQAKLALDQANLDVQAAQQALDTAKSQQISAVKEAEAQVIEAQAVLEKLQAGSSQQELLSAQAEVDKAQADYDLASQPASQDDINAAQADINQARATLDRLNKGGSEQDIAVAQAQVDKYQQQVDDLSKGPLPSDLAQAQGQLEQATAQVNQAQLQIDSGSLQAPYNSVVQNVYITPGQTVSTNSAAFTLVDLSGLTVEARVNQTNIQQIRASQPIRMMFQNISGVRQEPFTGKVTFVSFQAKGSPSQPQTDPSKLSPASSSDASMPSLEAGFPVSIALDQDDDLGTLKPGMIGQVTFVLARKTGVLLVPKVAVRTIPTGNVVDVVLPSGNLVATPIKAGLVNQDYVELADNTLLREGDNIVLYGATPPPITTPTPTVGGTPGSVTPGSPSITSTASVSLTVTPSVRPSSTVSTPAPTVVSTPTAPTPTTGSIIIVTATPEGPSPTPGTTSAGLTPATTPSGSALTPATDSTPQPNPTPIVLTLTAPPTATPTPASVANRSNPTNVGSGSNLPITDTPAVNFVIPTTK